jgi:HAMP domain-containing protein
MIVGSVYLALVAVMLLVLAVGEGRLRAAREMAEAERPQAEAAREESERWRAIRNAVDPSDFALDLFAAVAAALPAETVRFTQVSIGDGAIALSGEAAEVSQTYDMIERLKAADALSAYDWTAKPPDIAGRNVVRFEIEGRRADAISDSE